MTTRTPALERGELLPALATENPFALLRQVSAEMDRIFGDAFTGFGWGRRGAAPRSLAAWTQAMEIVELAAIQVANSVGAISIATTRTRAKAAALKDAGAAHVIATSEQDLVAEVNHATGGKGARLVFDPVAGPQVEKLAEAMSRHGILFIYGALATAPTPFPVIAAMQKTLTLRGYTLFEFVRDKERLARASDFIEEGLAGERLSQSSPGPSPWTRSSMHTATWNRTSNSGRSLSPSPAEAQYARALRPTSGKQFNAGSNRP